VTCRSLLSVWQFLVYISACSAAVVFAAEPPPSAEAQKRAIATIHSLFEEEFASDNPKVRLELVRELFRQAGVPANDLPSRFALFREGIRLAAENGDATAAFAGSEAMAEFFTINQSQVDLYAAGLLSKSIGDAAQARRMFERSQELIGELQRDRKFEAAEKLASLLGDLARRLRDRDAMLVAANLKKEVVATAAQFAKIRGSLEKLETSPDDEKANLEVGKFECFEMGRWEIGLDHLSRGADPALADLAVRTRAAPEAAPEQAELGKAWWEVAESLADDQRARAKVFAATWYAKAAPNLKGLPKVAATKRIEEAQDLAKLIPSAAGSPQLGRVVNLIPLIDLQQDAKPADKWTIKVGMLMCTRGFAMPKVIFPYKPPQEYDVKYVFLQPRLRSDVGVILPNPKLKSSFAWGAGGSKGFIGLHEMKPATRFPGIIKPNVPYAVEINVRKDRIVAKVNGKVFTDHANDYSDLKIGHWHSIRDNWEKIALFVDDPTQIANLQVVEITGKGELTRKSDSRLK
jgi:hypothetical protein